MFHLVDITIIKSDHHVFLTIELLPACKVRKVPTTVAISCQPVKLFLQLLYPYGKTLRCCGGNSMIKQNRQPLYHIQIFL